LLLTFARTPRERVAINWPQEVGGLLMDECLSLEQRRSLLKKMISESLQKKLLVEMNIKEQFEELKRLEMSLEKMRATQENGSLASSRPV
jgi:hypothetical protein